jgi:PAS domain S-box-containing protein
MFKKFLSQPIFEDQEQTYFANQLWMAVWVMLAASTAYLVAWVIIAPDKSIRILFALPLYPLFLFQLFLIRKGNLKLASIFLVGGLWLVLFTATAFSGGVLAPGYSGLLITVLAAGIFLGRNWAFGVAALSVAAGGILIYLDSIGVSTVASEYTDATTMWIAQSVYIFVAASLLHSATQRISNALSRAKHELEERKNIEKQLGEAEILYRTLVEETSVVIYRDTAQENSPSLFISKQIKNLLGYTPEEFSRNPEFWISLIHPDDKEMVLESVHKTLSTGSSISIEYRMKSKNENWVWVRDESILIKDENGKPIYLQGVYLDITERKQAEAQRESLIQELENKNSELERFTYTVSHDLKAPLITMSGFLGYLIEDAKKGNISRLESDVNRILDANLKMQRLLNELLELSRVGRLMNTPESLSFEQIVKESLSIVESQIKDKQIEIVIHKNLPIVSGDKVRLIEVIQNLVDNAAKFMGEQPKPRIEIGVKQENQQNNFFVRDNGIGIEKEYHEKIFELFNKLNPNASGTGIGLALVKRIIEVHKGKVWVESELGKGSTFYFTLGS